MPTSEAPSSSSALTELRLQLFANGYTPECGNSGRSFMEHGPDVRTDETEIRSWEHRYCGAKTTGLRLENKLAVIRLDIDDPAVSVITDAVMVALAPSFNSSTPLVRKGPGYTEYWLVRVEEGFERIFSATWIKPGQTVEHGTHLIEILATSGSVFPAFGPIGMGDDKFEWRGESPLNVPLSTLPLLTKQQCHAAVAAASATLRGRGWTCLDGSFDGEGAQPFIYDLVNDMVFRCHDGVQRSLYELKKAAKNTALRCSANWLEPQAVNLGRCAVLLTEDGKLVVYDECRREAHAEASAEPIKPTGDREAEKHEKLFYKILPGDEFALVVAKILKSFVYCPYQPNDVVPVWASNATDGMSLAKFRAMMLPHAYEERGPRGGSHLVNPVDVWMKHPERLTVAGLRMRPDKPKPIYEDRGDIYVNTYSPPLLAARGGSAAIGLDFIEHLIPDPNERAFFSKWLAFKYRNPHVPGPAIVMVAHGTFGTGRGTLAELLSRLFGRQYVRSIPFAAFTGKTYQSQYNEWLSESVVVVVNESSETPISGSKYAAKRNVYEHLKEIVEPRAIEREIFVKGRANYRAISSASFLIATNHADALPIPEDDRRFAVLRNGQTKPQPYWDRLNAWMEDDANIAAFGRHLESVSLDGYSPYSPPPVFEGKARMIDEAKSDLERAYDIVLRNLQSPVFTLAQLESRLRTTAYENSLHLPQPLDVAVRALTRQALHRVGVRDGKNWSIRFGNRKTAVYAPTASEAARYTELSAEALRIDILKNGSPEGVASGPRNALQTVFGTPIQNVG